MKKPLSVFSLAVLYEDSATRDHAAFTCERLKANLGDELEIQTSWWRFDFLLDPRIGWDATETAAGADMIVFAMHAGREVPAVIRSWVESWADSRTNDFGAIVGLIGITASPDNWDSPRHHFLKHLAERAHMDYLPQGHVNPDELPAKTLSQLAEKPQTVTAVPKDILSHSAPTPTNPTSHWGLNE